MIDGEVTWAIASNYLLLFWDLHPNLSLWNGLGDLNLTVVNISKSLPSSTKWKSLIRPGSLSLSLCVCVCVCVCVYVCLCCVYQRVANPNPYNTPVHPSSVMSHYRFCTWWVRCEGERKWHFNVNKIGPRRSKTCRWKFLEGRFKQGNVKIWK